MSFVTLKNYHARTIAILDASDAIVELPVRIKRFTVEELQAVQAHKYRMEHPDHERAMARRPEGDEQEMVPVKVGELEFQRFRIPDAEVTRRRLEEMSDDQRAAYWAAARAHDAGVLDIAAQLVTAYVTVDPGCQLRLDREDGPPVPVRTGADLVEALGGDQAVLLAMMRAVIEENFLSTAEKKALRSRAPSSTGSSTTPAGAGPTHGTTAASAAPSGSARPAPASAHPRRRRSG